jgi:hypothetical protein
MIDDLRELLALRGHKVSAADDGLEVNGVRVRFVEAFDGDTEVPAVVLTLEHAGGEPAEGVAVLDLLARRLHGSSDPAVLDSVREFCRKRGIRFEPGPWRYSGGLI